MLQNAQSEMTAAPWIAIYPGLMIFIVVSAMNTSGARLREAQANLDSGTPIEMARQKLIHTGLNRDLVEQVIAQVAGPDRKRCPADSLTYRLIGQRGAQCGAALEILPQV
jgi:hypothetical protein